MLQSFILTQWHKPSKGDWCEINAKLSNDDIHHAVVYDECPVSGLNYSKMRANPNMYIVMIIPFDTDNIPRLPSETEWVKYLRLDKSYRQSQHCLLTYNYLSTHGEEELDFSQTIGDADEDRCPEGFKSLWIECSSEENFYNKALIRVKEILESERLGGPGVAVVGLDVSDADKKFCSEQGWECSGYDDYDGIEADVSTVASL